MPVFFVEREIIYSRHISSILRKIYFIFSIKGEIIYLTTMKIYSKKYLTFHSLYAIINTSNKGGFQYETYSTM